MASTVTPEQLAEARRDLGQRLASLRDNAGLTQAQLARLTGYTRSAIANVETGRSSQPRTSWARYDQLLDAGGSLLAGYDRYATLTEQHSQQAARERERQRNAKINQWRHSRVTASTGSGADGGYPGPLVTDHAGVSGMLSHDSLLAVADAGDEVRRRDLLVGGLATAGVGLSGPARAAQALGIAIMDHADRLGAAVDHLYQLIDHYSEAICRTPSLAMYTDLYGVRSFAGRLLADVSPPARRRRNLIVVAGWLSNLLAVAASYLGDHPSALVWCTDAQRRGQDAGNPELSGWAYLTRAMIAYYDGQAQQSVLLACRGQQVAPTGTAVHARLAAQQMRAHAMLGDADGMARGRRRAASAIAKLPPAVPRTGTFSVALGQDPPYTATSLLLVGQFEQASAATRRVLDTVYPGGTPDQKPTSNYARTLLILGLAEAGRGNAAEAAEAGQQALVSAAPVWPTMVLASKLDRALVGAFPGVAEAADYHARYLDVAGRTPQLTASHMEDHR